MSLAIDRDAINDAECGGMGVVDGNWINNDVEYGMEWPKWEHDIAKARKLMAEAGHPNGFTVDWVTPVPNYYSRGERIVSQLQAIGIRSTAAGDGARRLPEKDAGRPEGMARRPDHLQCDAHRRHVVELVRYDVPLRWLQCQGFLLRQGSSTISSQSTWLPLTETNASSIGRADPASDPRGILFRAGVPPCLRQRDRAARRQQKWQDVFPTITSGYCYPWEDILPG